MGSFNNLFFIIQTMALRIIEKHKSADNENYYTSVIKETSQILVLQARDINTNRDRLE